LQNLTIVETGGGLPAMKHFELQLTVLYLYLLEVKGGRNETPPLNRGPISDKQGT
jgi:hypothetical protein